jgi:hypothetical protein
VSAKRLVSTGLCILSELNGNFRENAEMSTFANSVTGFIRTSLISGVGFWVIAYCEFVLIPGALHPPRPRWAREILSRMGLSANPINRPKRE